MDPQRFIERKLLPAINRQDPEKCHNMLAALEDIETAPTSSELERVCAKAVSHVVNAVGIHNFKIHPKGTGVFCHTPEGISSDVFICEYLGEAVPPWRWFEKQDTILDAQEAFQQLTPTLTLIAPWLLCISSPSPQG